MTSRRKQLIHALLKGIETGDPESVKVVNQSQYIQHNPQTHEGDEGLAALFKRLSKTSPRVNIVRIFSDGDFVFAHTEYDFSSQRVGFEMFRFEGNQTVEHWDNIQSRQGPNSEGHSMVDGIAEVSDLDKTESNRELVQSFVNEVLISRQLNKLSHYIDIDHYIEHNPKLSSLSSVHLALSKSDIDGRFSIQYDKSHRILAEGNFVLSACEGHYQGQHSSFYDLFRLEAGKIIEHWDTREVIHPKSEWKNNNGKF